MNRSFLSIRAGIGFLLCLNNSFLPEMISQKVKASFQLLLQRTRFLMVWNVLFRHTIVTVRMESPAGKSHLKFNGPKFAGTGF